MTSDFYILLKAAITGELDRTDGFERTDWEAMMDKFTQQSVVGLGFDAVQLLVEKGQSLKLPTEVILRWYAASESVNKQNVKLNMVLHLLVKTLDEAGIESLLLKGQGCAVRYPKPMLRVPGDIDLLVGEEKFDQAMKVLGEAGLIDSKGHSDRKHTTIMCDGISVELHRRGDNVPGRKRSEKFQRAVAESLYKQHGCGFWLKEDGSFGEGEGCVWIQTLPDELNVVYVFIHMFRHFIQGGVRLRQVCDWLVLLLCYVEKEGNVRLIRQLVCDFGFLEAWRAFCAMADSCLDLRVLELLQFTDKDMRKSKMVLRIIEKAEITSNSISGKGVWRRLREILSLYVSCFKAFGIFPRKCVGYLTEIVWSNVRKYVLRRKY